MTTAWPPRSIATLRLYAQLRRVGVRAYLPLELPAHHPVTLLDVGGR